jgi:hypothetical protein
MAPEASAIKYNGFATSFVALFIVLGQAHL